MRLRTNQEQYYRDRVVSLAPVSYWMMQEQIGSVVRDEIGVNFGAYQNSPPLAQAGGILPTTKDGSVSFNGSNQNIIVPHSTSLAIVADITIEMMIYPRAFSGSVERLYAKQTSLSGDLFPAAYQLVYIGSAGQIGLVLGNGSAQTNTTSTAGMALNTWHLIQATQKGTTTTYWLDGKQNGQFSNAQARADTGGAVQIMGQGTRYPNARAAHVAIYNRALGEDEIVRNYRIFAGVDKSRKLYFIPKFSPAMRWWHGA